MDKRSLFTQISANLRGARDQAEQARDTAQKEANSHVGRMESRYDTFKEEAQYEVAAQELRIRQYQDGINQIGGLIEDASNLKPNKTIRVGSIVILEPEGGKERCYILSPAGGGILAKDGDTSVFTLTPDSPLGKQLVGLEEGDECALDLGESKTNYLVKKVL